MSLALSRRFKHDAMTGLNVNDAEDWSCSSCWIDGNDLEASPGMVEYSDHLHRRYRRRLAMVAEEQQYLEAAVEGVPSPTPTKHSPSDARALAPLSYISVIITDTD